MCMYRVEPLTAEEKARIKQENRSERQRAREAKKAIVAVGELPSDFSEWVDTIFEKVMFYNKIKRGKYVARCEACQATVELTHACSSRRIQCPSCGLGVVLKRIKFPSGVHQQRKIAVLDRAGKCWVQRLFLCERSTCLNDHEVYSTTRVGEEQRDYLDENDTVWHFHPVPYSVPVEKARWEKGCGKIHGMGWTGWRVEDGPLFTYPNNLSTLFQGSKLQYSAIEIATEKTLVNPFYYLKKYKDEPKLELLYKVGLYRIAQQLQRNEWYTSSAKRLIRDVKSLKDLGIDSPEEARTCSNFSIELLIARKEVKAWKVDDSVRELAWKFVEKINERSGTDFNYDFITRERWFKYYLTQAEIYKEVGNFIGDYIDYIGDCVTLGLNLKDTAVNRPKSLKVSHDWARNEIKVQETQVYDALIEATHDSLCRLVEWTDGNITVVMPRSSREIVEEGVRQKHCVGRYCERVAVGESVILFLRHADSPNENFFTMEIKKDMEKLDIVQCRGFANGEKTEEVEKFLKKYKRWFNHRPIDDYDAGNIMVHYFKAVRKKDGKYISNYDHKTEFKIGEWKEAELDRDSDKVAVKGLHVASLEFAQNWGDRWEDVAILEVETNIHDVVVPDAKDQVRTSRFRVIREVPFEEMGEWGAKRLARAAGKVA